MIRSKPSFLSGMFVLALFMLLSVGQPHIGAQEEKEAKRPNVVFIIADDLGYTDVNPFDPREHPYYETPHINRLAKQGVRFTSAYANSSNCAPSRAALFSGQYYPRQPVYTVGSGAQGKKKHRKVIPPKNQKILPEEKVTLAEALKQGGYSTGFIGKWHIGKPGSTGPIEQGFDLNIGGYEAGSPNSFGGYFNGEKNPKIDNDDIGENEYLTDYLSRKAVEYIRNHADDEPFYLQFSHYSPHNPYEAPESRTRKYRKKEPVNGHNNPSFAAMIESVDRSTGCIMKTLKEEGIANNTILIFYSDNGGPGGYAEVGLETKRWDITNNHPLKGGKGMFYEGGIRVPLIIRWPGKAPAGTSTSQPVIGTDFYPTLLDAVGIEPPEEYTLDGRSFLPVLKDPATQLDVRPLYWHFPGYLSAWEPGTWRTRPVSVIRYGPWKLMKFYGNNELKLYNLKKDIGETNNLAKQEPGVRKRLHQRLNRWLEKMDAPIPKKP